MKTPIVYYGGKTNMLKHVLPLISGEHRTFVEPFFGGGAVFFAKKPSKVEIINDKFGHAINFYRMVKTNFPKLQKMIQGTLHSEGEYTFSRAVLKGDVPIADPVIKAWAFWCQCRLTFSHVVYGGFAFANGNVASTTRNTIDAFTDEIQARLQHTQIFARDALDIIKRFDRTDTFFYLDPPYPESDCAHYRAGRNVFYDLVELLPSLKGKWLLSSYPGEVVDRLRERPGINFQDIRKPLSVSGKNNAGKQKIECLTWNYDLT